jgi:hypothetical protein
VRSTRAAVGFACGGHRVRGRSAVE